MLRTGDTALADHRNLHGLRQTLHQGKVGTPKSRFRGIRLFEFREDNPMAYVTRMMTWGDLVGRYSSNELRVFFEDHCVTDLIGVRNELRRPQVSATLLGAGAVACGAIGYAVRGLLRKSQ